MKIALWLTLALLSVLQIDAQTKFTVSGYVRAGSSGEDILGANIYTKDFSVGTSTNVYGFYSITLPEGEYELIFSYVGFDSKSISFVLTADLSLNMELFPGTIITNQA
ncbi:MAG: hypothetical protein ACI943_002425, partial [Gammaproteobacteria bacterium]